MLKKKHKKMCEKIGCDSLPLLLYGLIRVFELFVSLSTFNHAYPYNTKAQNKLFSPPPPPPPLLVSYSIK